MNYILIIGVCQSLIALMLLQTSQKRRPVHFMIFWLLVCICTHLSIKFFIYVSPHTGVFQKGFNTFIDLAYGPLLWMIAQKVRDDRYTIQRHWYLFLPAVFAALAYVSIAGYILAESSIPLNAIAFYNSITTYFITFSLILFPVFTFQAAQRLPDFWKRERQMIMSIAVLFFFIGLICVTGQVISLFAEETGNLHLIMRGLVYSILAAGTVLIVHYLYTMQSDFVLSASSTEGADEKIPATLSGESIGKEDIQFLSQQEEALPDGKWLVAPGQQKAATRNILSSNQQEDVILQLERLMKDKKIYTDPELSLEKLSTISKIPRHHITEALHRYGGSSFYQFINQYRIGYVIVSLDKCRQQDVSPNILSLAFEAGFNSKSTFNHYFKKITTQTPSEYLKNQRLKHAPTPSLTTVKKDFIQSELVG